MEHTLFQRSVFIFESHSLPQNMFFKMDFLGMYLGSTKFDKINNIQKNVE